MDKWHTMGRTPEIELIVLLKPLVLTWLCYLWLGKFEGAWLSLENFHKQRKARKAATNNFRGYLILKWLAPLSVVSGQEEVVFEGDSRTSVRSSYLSVTTGGGRTGISSEPI